MFHDELILLRTGTARKLTVTISNVDGQKYLNNGLDACIYKQTDEHDI
jgi:hypothetical protein